MDPFFFGGITTVVTKGKGKNDDKDKKFNRIVAFGLVALTIVLVAAVVFSKLHH
jgi:hypothetical protein